MATSFKTLLSGDIKQHGTKLHEAIPLTGTILSGTYGAFGAETNVKNYSHGMFQSVYDYPYLSSSANHILDITVGVAADSGLSGSANYVQTTQKNDIYNEMAQMLCGYDATGSIHQFDVSGAFGSNVATDKMKDVVFVNFARLLTKDEIQKETGGGFTLVLNAATTFATPSTTQVTLQDTNATNALENSPAGQFNVLYASSPSVSATACGLVFYQAGIAVISSSVFQTTIAGGNSEMNVGTDTMPQLLVSGAISSSADALRHRFHNVGFNNTTELNSTIYMCRAGASEFNYSSNPTYLSSSQIRVKNVSTDNPVSYITTVGLYGANNELLAVGKLSEPLKKTPADEFVLRVRLDY
jgi:hypothetical protein